MLLRYLRHTSGYSPCQVTRLVAQWGKNRLATVPLAKRYCAPRALPEVQAELDHREPAGLAGDRGHDAQIDLHIAGKSFAVLIEAKKAVYPRDVREVLWRFREVGHNRPKAQSGDKAVSVLVAESISPGAKELLRDAHVGYYDSGGSLFLPAPGVYLYIDKPPPPKSYRNRYGLCFPGGARRCCTPC